MTSTVRKGKKTEGEKFKDYFDYNEPSTSCRRTAFSRCSGREGRNPRAADEPEANVPVAGVPSSYELKIMQRFAISDQAARATAG